MSAKASDVKKGAGKGGESPSDTKVPPEAPTLEDKLAANNAFGKLVTSGTSEAPEGASQISDKKADDAAPVEEDTSTTEYAGKISPKEIMQINFRDEIMAGRMKLPCKLYTVIGRANNLRDGESDYGPWTAARGEFEATRVHDGKTFLGKECHVPGPAGELLVDEVRKYIVDQVPATSEEIKKRGRTYNVTGEFVDLAVLVGLKATARAGGQPYEFTVESIIPVKRSDALAAMRQRALGLLKAVPASQRLALPAPTPPAPEGTPAANAK